MSSNITFSVKAYCKIVLHAAKYPHCSVNGVLLCKLTSLKTKDIEIEDAVPLFHIAVNLTPMAEVALMQIDELVSQRGLVICGYYTALENARDCSFEKAYHRITDKLISTCSSPCLVLVDNRRLSIRMENISLKVAQCVDGTYKPIEANNVSVKPSNTLDVCSILLEKGAYDSVIDFDNHLDDITLDWMNPELNKEVDSIVESFN